MIVAKNRKIYFTDQLVNFDIHIVKKLLRVFFSKSSSYKFLKLTYVMPANVVYKTQYFVDTGEVGILRNYRAI